jgi:CHAT domain-containing protein/tetratricopeptide (TPR) repeat protein
MVRRVAKTFGLKTTAVTVMLLFVAGGMRLNAQAAPERRVEMLLREVDSLLETRSPERAREALDRCRAAGEIAVEIRNPRLRGWAYIACGKVFMQLGPLGRSLAQFDSARTMLARYGSKRDLFDALNALSFVLTLGDSLDAARVYTRSAYDLLKDVSAPLHERAIVGQLLGVVLTGLQQRTAAFPILYEAQARLDSLRRIGFPEGQLIVMRSAIYSSLADLFISLPNRDSALKYIQLDASLGQAEAFNSFRKRIDLELVSGSLDSALSYAVVAQRNAQKPDGWLEVSLTRLYTALGRPQQAGLHLVRAAQLFRQESNRRGFAETKLLAAEALQDQPGEAQANAEIRFREAIDASRSYHYATTEIRALMGMAHLMFERQNAPEALRVLDDARTKARVLGMRRELGHILSAMGRAHAALLNSDSVYYYYSAALGELSAAHDEVGVAEVLESRAWFEEHHITESHIRVARADYDSAYVLMDSISRALESELDFVAFRDRFTSVVEERVVFELGNNPDGARIGLAIAENARTGEFARSLSAGYPACASPCRKPALPRVDPKNWKPRPTVGAGATLFYLTTFDGVYVWWIHRDGTITLNVGSVTRSEMVSLVRAIRSGLGARSELGGAPGQGSLIPYDSAVSRLSELLIPKELTSEVRDTAELVVVPDGLLSSLPFNVLRAAGTTIPVGIRYALRYIPSLSAGSYLDQPRARSELVAASKALVIGDPLIEQPRTDLAGVDTTGVDALVLEEAVVRLSRELGVTTLGQLKYDTTGVDTIPALESARIEAQSVAHELGVKPVLREVATESLVRTGLASASIVHLATHAVSETWDYLTLNSYIALARDARHDGRLTMGEILNDPSLLVRSDLIVLSACETSLGQIGRVGGSLGLQRALIARGARSVMSSLWPVQDVATAELMQRFYKYWHSTNSRVSKAEALRRAQRDLFNGKWNHPTYWAAFQLLGGL